MNLLNKKKLGQSSASFGKPVVHSDGEKSSKAKVYESYKSGFFIGQALYEQEISKK